MVQGKIVDGMIITYSKKDDKVVPYLKEKAVPFVVIGKPVREANEIMHVDNNNVLAGAKVTEHLINLGHKRIAFVGDNPEYQVVLDRLEGFFNKIRKHGLDIPKHYIQLDSWNNDVADHVMNELFKKEPYPTAIVATNDTIALYLLSAFAKENIKVPDDISMISFDNTLISQLATPKMTSVDIQTFQLGLEAAKYAIELIKDPAMFKKSVIIPTEIIERDSTRRLKNNERTRRDVR